MNCEVRPAGFFSPGCQGLWRFGKRTPPGLDRSNGSLSELAADSLAAFFWHQWVIAPKTARGTKEAFLLRNCSIRR